jgi:hypothetical protein
MAAMHKEVRSLMKLSSLFLILSDFYLNMHELNHW